MPVLVAWNLEMFGKSPGDSSEALQKYDEIRLNLVASLILDMNADIVVIQELKSAGVELLAMLIQLLPGDWSFDWIPASLTSNGMDGKLPTFDFRAINGNSEGYAVVWKGDVLTTVAGGSAGKNNTERALEGTEEDNFINLVVDGFQIGFTADENGQYGEDCVTFDTTTPCDQPLGFPPAVFGDLNSDRAREALCATLSVRRPCYVNVATNYNGAQRTMPVVVYHAPVGSKNSATPIFGSMIGLASRALAPLYPGNTPGNNLVTAYAGDFNLKSFDRMRALQVRQQALGYNSSTITLQQEDTSSFRTMVKFSTMRLRDNAANRWRNSVTTNNPSTFYLTSSRDFAATVAIDGAQVSLSIANCVDIIQGGGETADYLLTGTTVADLVVLVQEASQVAINGVTLAQILDVYLQRGTVYPAGTDACTAIAFIYNMFVSDHLPVVVELP